jgi:hypothetical protein
VTLISLHNLVLKLPSHHCLTRLIEIGARSEVSELLKEYPDLVEADVYACLACGAEMSRERYIDIPLETSMKWKLDNIGRLKLP